MWASNKDILRGIRKEKGWYVEMKIAIDDFKKYLSEEIEKITLNNVKEQVSYLRDRMEVLEYLYEKEMLGNGEVRGVDEPQSVEEVNVEIVEKGEQVTDLKEGEYYFKKKLMGGELVGEYNSHISEMVVRDIGLQSGDIVHVGNLQEIAKTLKLVKKAEVEVEDTEFEVYRYATVKYEDGMYYCDEYYDGGKKRLKMGGVPYKYRISPQIQMKLFIESGDMVDLGINKDSPNYMKVVWKHKNEKRIIQKPTSMYKSKTEKSNEGKFSEVNFNGTKIVVAGCEPRKAIFERAIKECNGEMVFLDGDENDDRLQPAVEGADVVILLRDFLSHPFVRLAVKHAKNANKPFSVPDGVGVQNLIYESQKLVEQL